jgi:hypothetical protein
MDEERPALAEGVRRYLAADDHASENAQRALAGQIARLVGELLKAAEGWSPYWWVDDFHVETAEKVAPLGVKLTGTLIWGDERNQWIDPFRAVLDLSSPSAGTVSYTFEFGDESTGLGIVRFGERPPRAWDRVVEWVFRFQADEEPF